jgi:hypothetical protein
MFLELVETRSITLPDVSMGSLAGLNKPEGADLSLGRRLARSPDPELESRVSRREAAVHSAS